MVPATELEDQGPKKGGPEMADRQRDRDTAALHMETAPHASQLSLDRGAFPLKYNDVHWRTPCLGSSKTGLGDYIASLLSRSFLLYQ